MNVMQHLTLASLLAFCTAFANVAIAEDIPSAQQIANDQMTSQQELIDLFFAAAKTGQQEVIQEFLKYGFPVNIKNQAGFTPLMMATYYGHQDTVTTLLNYGADRCLRDNKGNTALMGAIFKLEWKIAKQLRQIDCDTNAKQTGQKTTAEFAKILGQEEQLQKIVASYQD